MNKPPRERRHLSSVRRRHKRFQPPAFPPTKAFLPSPDENLESDDDDIDVSCLEPVHGPSVITAIMSSEHTLFLGLLAFRVINALVLQTSFVPDEYWQSIEVAHKMAFGYGYQTWEWQYGLRGYVYPLLFALPYKIVGFLHLDHRILLIKLPLVIQAFFAALGDVYLYKLSTKLAGVYVGRWSLLCQMTSWFTFYCAPRTLTNSMETVLSTMALYYFPWPGFSRKAHWKYVVLVGLAVVIRPTAAIMWLPLILWHLYMYKHVFWKVVRLLVEKGFLILTLSSIVDRAFYGKWTYVQLNFLEFNVFSGLGSFYGSHPWHWYLTQGLAVILGVQLFPFVLALRKGMQPTFVKIIAWTVAVYSCLGHKEFRFLLPILPLAMHLCGLYLAQLTGGGSQNHTYDSNAEDESTSSDSDRTHPSRMRRSKSFRPSLPASDLPCTKSTFFILLLVAGNLPLALYTALIHQRGTLDVMRFIHDEASKPDNQSIAVMSLMPCHSIPHYSHLHKNISLHFLTCEPNLNAVENYTDEADVFYKDPVLWLNATFRTSHLPTHLVIFNVLLPQISAFLEVHHYEKCAEFFHTHVPEGRVGGYVFVLCSEEWRNRFGRPDPYSPQMRKKRYA